MSYTLVKTVVLPRTIGSQWKEVDINSIPLKQVYIDYYKIYVELSHVTLTDNIYIDLDTFKHDYVLYTGTIIDLLVLLGDATLNTVAALPSESIKYVKYSDAFRCNGT